MMRLIAVAATLLLCGGIAVARGGLSEGQELALAKRQAEQALRRSGALERQAAAATDEAARARAASEALVARIEAAEAEITAAEARIRIIENRRAEQRARLARRQEPLIRLTAALQTMSRRPPALALIQPGALDDTVRVRALLASTLPVIRARTAGLRAELAEEERLRGQAEVAVAALVAGREELKKQRTALTALELRRRRQSEQLIQSAMVESDRALAFTEEARELGEELENRSAREALRERLMALAAPIPRPGPATAEQRQGPVYRLPLEGRLVRGMGDISDAGVHARGLTIEAAGRAQVVAPSRGRIAYAAPFRDYGRVVIIDHGGGWTTTITNLEELGVRAGDAVAMGAPLGRTGADGTLVSVELRRGGVPVPIAPLLASG